MSVYHAENVLPIEEKHALFNLICSDTFPWYYNASTAPKKYEVYGEEGGMTNSLETHQFTHTFFKNNKINSDFFHVIEPFFPIIDSIFNFKVIEIDRIKANLMTPMVRNFNETNPKHHDADVCKDGRSLLSIIYYVNESDGDTILYNKEYPDQPNDLKEKHRIKPIENSMVVFPSTLYHAGSNPINFSRRIVLNFVLEVK